MEDNMFTGFTEETIQFFLDLKFHNNADFFHGNHDRYVEVVQTPFYQMIEDLAPYMLKIDPHMEVRPYKCLSRIHRDTRFSKDKSPYRDHLWFLFRQAAESREKSLFYYFEMGPDRLGWGMGFWGENREAHDLFRKRMRANPDGTLALLDDLNMDKRGLILGGTTHKRYAEGVVAERPWVILLIAGKNDLMTPYVSIGRGVDDGAVLKVDGHLNVAIDVGRPKETGLDADLHLGDLRDVEALACEVGYAVVAALIVCIVVFIRVFIIGIRIIRGFFVSQETLDQLFEFFI
jgi:uncharacterized protein (TIGR02453 family)